MQSLSPLAIPVFVVLAVGVLLALAAFVTDWRRFSGYRDLADDARELAKKLHGEVFRDGDDLVVNGTVTGLPVQVRFSHADNMPGLDIRLGAPADFNLFVTPRTARAREGKHVLRTTDEMLNARVEVRTDQPTQGRLLLTAEGVPASLSTLCRSASTVFRITRGVVELIDLTPPSHSTIATVPAQLSSMQAIVSQVKEMPGADTVKVEPLKREQRYLMKVSLAAGVAAVIAAILIGVGMSANTGEVQQHIAAADEVLETDAPLIPSVSKWHVVNTDQFNTDDVAWLGGSGIKIAGRIIGDFAGKGAKNDVAYVLANASGEKRVVILSGGVRAFDSRYPYVGIAAVVPRESVSSIEWTGAPPDHPAGDGLLIVRAPNDRGSGLIIFTRGGQAVSGVPKDYQSVRLE